ncbi:hypothetical protein FOTG_15232 [Fusarium oxysporum f. sp. vasinfectum 25433]|uniref:NADH:flavin oxidoreductase/NADH oxidase N-terminal domain-containing protein n=1 Tax=Fusarium oxysporum f. sp. vasinfectum 25433 TaxID=1089449 RepID=X0L683_FUSOX|nr:hypothetical protein FOTG_15232 [Fusarium oxysporum f. sp. vasinfectum 25433]
MMREYYAQRASIPGTLLITEATFVSAKSRGRDENAPGIFTQEQVEAWRHVTEDVHSNGSFIFMQLWHVGRAARQHALDKAGLEMVSSSDIPMSEEYPTPRPMTTEEIWECIASFDPEPQFTYLISQLKHLGLVYLHLIEPRIAGNVDREVDDQESLGFALDAWGRTGPVILAGGYTAEKANKALETTFKDQPIAFGFGRHFISNPDLPLRLARNIPLAPYHRDTFYKVKSADGYTDYPFSEEWLGGQKLDQTAV